MLNRRVFQNHKGHLLFTAVSFSIVACSILTWFFVLRASTYQKIDCTLSADVHERYRLCGALRDRNIAPEQIRNILINLPQHPSGKFAITISGDSVHTTLYATGMDTTFFSPFATTASLEHPVTYTVAGTDTYHVFGTASEGISVWMALPLPSFWGILWESVISLAILIPCLAILLAAVGIWGFFYLHAPIHALDNYLDALIRQPLGKELAKPPVPPRGDIYQLTQTVTKIVERLHASRNQALQFSSFATHELRTPMSIIRNQLEAALASNVRPKELRGTVASAYDEILRLNRAVEDLLSLSTMQTGTLPLNLETISLLKFLNTFYDEALFLTRPKNITVVLKGGSDLYMRVDVIRFRQVFFNLLDNAIKNTPSGKRIRLSFTLENDHVLISFADTGVGIAADKIEKIFDPFFTHSAGSGSHHGTGLGLALVKWIIELHHGKIAVSSELGVGTEFSISLPYDRTLQRRKL